MASQAWILLCAILLSVLPASQGIGFSITRTPNEKICARARCLNHIDDDVTSFSTTKISVYEVTEGGNRKLLASASADKPTVYIDPARRSDVTGSAEFSDDHSEVTLEFNKENDCSRGTFQCELQLLSEQGRTNVVRETVSPGYSQGECTCASITEQFNLLFDSANSAGKELGVLKQRSGDLTNGITSVKQVLNNNEKDITRLRRNSTTIQGTLNVLRQDGKKIEAELTVLSRNKQAMKDSVAQIGKINKVHNEAIANLVHNEEVHQAAFTDVKADDAKIQELLAELEDIDVQFRKTGDALRRNNDDHERVINELSLISQQFVQVVKDAKDNNSKIDDNIDVLTHRDKLQAEGIASLQHHNQTHQQSILDHQKSDEDMQEIINSIVYQQNANANTLKSLQQKAEAVEQGVTSLTQHDVETDAVLLVLGQTDDDFKELFAELQHNDTVMQQQLADHKRDDQITLAEITQLTATASNLYGQVTVMLEADVRYSEMITSEAQSLSLLGREYALLLDESTVLEKRIEQFNSLFLSISAFFETTKVTTSTKTHTKITSSSETSAYTAHHTSRSESVYSSGRQ